MQQWLQMVLQPLKNLLVGCFKNFLGCIGHFVSHCLVPFDLKCSAKVDMLCLMLFLKMFAYRQMCCLCWLAAWSVCKLIVVWGKLHSLADYVWGYALAEMNETGSQSIYFEAVPGSLLMQYPRHRIKGVHTRIWPCSFAYPVVSVLQETLKL